MSDNLDLKKAFNKVMKEYVDAKHQEFKQHPLAKCIRTTIPGLIKNTGLFDENEYGFKGSAGQGNWANVPWVAVLDKKETTTVQTGVDIVYLFSDDGKSLYLTLNQGCSELADKYGYAKTKEILKNNAEVVRGQISTSFFDKDNGVKLGDDLHPMHECYEEGAIFYKEYKKNRLPSTQELIKDLDNMRKIYKKYVDKYPNGISNQKSSQSVTENKGKIKNNIDSLKEYICSKGYVYDDGIIENFYLSLKSKPFVILAGISGTGKTKLVRLFAEAVGATSNNGRYKLVAVRPDWSDSSDLFGHVTLNDKFIPGSIIDFIKKAENDIDNPYFLCLDEMNLARVEYYFSDVLSIIETREKIKDRIVTDSLIDDNYYGADISAKKEYGTIRIPENLYIIGTVNMDETTFPFSKKVLDRANTIEFTSVNLKANFKNIGGKSTTASLKNSIFKTEYIEFSQCSEEEKYVEKICDQLDEINTILSKANSHIGYRVRNEIVYYMLNNKNTGLLTEDEAFDYEIMQKILPRIQGSDESIKDMLCELFKEVAIDFEGYKTSDYVYEKMKKASKEKGCKYKKTAEKIAFMVRRFEEDGFTSFWQ